MFGLFKAGVSFKFKASESAMRTHLARAEFFIREVPVVGIRSQNSETKDTEPTPTAHGSDDNCIILFLEFEHQSQQTTSRNILLKTCQSSTL